MAETTSSSSSSGGIGFVGLLTIAFIVLKLTGYIDWSWWWVLSPIWITFLIVVGILLLIGIGGLSVWGFKNHRERKARKRELQQLEQRILTGTASPYDEMRFKRMQEAK